MPNHAIKLLCDLPCFCIIGLEVMNMFTLKEVMEMSNIPERTIRRHIKLGLLKGEQLGGTWRFSEEDLTNYFTTSIFKQNQNNIKYHEVFDALNGIVEFPN